MNHCRASPKTLLETRAQRFLPWLVLSPALAGLILFFYQPLVATLGTSLVTDALGNGSSASTSLGMDNYVAVFSNESFWSSLGFTLTFTLTSVLAELVVGMSLALFSFSVPKPLAWVVRSLIIIPWAIPQVIQASMWRWFLNAEFGPLGDILVKLGLVQEAPLFLGDPGLAFLSIIVASTWRGASIAAFFLMGALALVPKELREAAHVDGAGPIKTFARITLPLIAPVILVTVLFRSIDGLRVFDIIQGLTGGGPGNTTTSLSFYAYQVYFRFGQFGKAATHAVLNFLLVAIPGIFYIRWIQNRLDQAQS